MRLIGCLILLGFISSSCYGQGDTHCIPLNESRIIHQMAHESLLVPELKGKIELLESEKSTYRETFDQLMAIERSRYYLQVEKFNEQERISKGYNEQVKGLQKAERKMKRQRNVAVGLGLILLTVAAFK